MGHSDIPAMPQEIIAETTEGASADADNSGAQGSVAAAYELADLPGGHGAQQLTQIAALQAENATLRDQALRLAADFDNYRKRSRREQDDIRRFGIDRLLGALLPVADNLERALAHATDRSDPVISGVEMVRKHFGDVLAAQGVVAFVAKGEPFDPARHEAVSQQSSDKPPGTVLEELERGYMIHTRLLRAARVVVAAAPPSAP